MPLPRGVGLLVEIVEGSAGPGTLIADLEQVLAGINRNGIGCVGLQLDGIGTATLDKLVSEQSIPSVLVGRRRLFEPSKVIAALEEQNDAIAKPF